MIARDTTHERYEQLAVGHALSALEPEDEQAFLRHLPGCAACERALIEHTETLGHLAYAGDVVEPPASLLAGIREGVEASGRAGAFPLPEPAPVEVSSLDAARTRRRDRTVRWTTAVIGAAASVVMVVALLLVNRGLQSDQHESQVAASKLTKAVSALLVPGSHQVDMTGTDGQKAVAVVNGSAVSLVIQGVPVNDRSTSVYVLWARSSQGDVRAVGTFDVSSTDLSVVNDLSLPQKAVKTFMVTRESGRSAPAVTHQPVVVAGDV